MNTKNAIWSGWMLFSLSIFLLCADGCVGDSDHAPPFNIADVSPDDEIHPIIILGGGMAGLNAALATSRASIPTLIIEGSEPGGAITQSTEVWNLPGFEKISGRDFATRMKKQVQVTDAVLKEEHATSVDFASWPYTITTASIYDPDEVHTYKAMTVFIGMGAKPHFLNIPGEKKFWGKGISNCVTCDGPLYQDKITAIVGGGDSAMAEALELTRIADKVHVLVRRDVLRARDKKIVDAVRSHPNVEMHFNTVVTEVIGDGDGVTGIKIRNNKTNQTSDIQLAALFLAIGSTPNTAILKDKIDLYGSGYINLYNHQETSVPGVYAAGDISDPRFRQADTAFGGSKIAALQAIEFLQQVGYEPPEDRYDVVRKRDGVSEPSKEEEKPKDEVSQVTQPAGATAALIEITKEEEFHNLLKTTEKPIIVDFYSYACPPCRRMLPIFEELSKDFAGKVQFVKVNVQKVQSLLSEYKSRSIPTFVFLNTEGKEVDRILGAVKKEDFTNKIKNLIATK